jgi:cob(I)alamin adenosyltransferase
MIFAGGHPKHGMGEPVAKIYTGTGDDGTTGLVGGQRVPKDSPLIEACGSLDELNAHIGVVRSCGLPDDVNRMLQNIQSNLFTIGTQIATPEGSNIKSQRISDEEVGHLEHAIDALENTLPPLRQFILPGGSMAAAALHLARTVARRAERRCVTLSRSGKIDPQVLRYLNRLSDLCFLLARYANQYQSVPELHPSIRTGS